MNDRDEQSGTNDRPEHREGMPADLNGEGLWHAKLVCKPRPNESPDEAEGYGDKAPAVGPSSDSSADPAADTGDDQEKDKPWYGEAHNRSLLWQRDRGEPSLINARVTFHDCAVASDRVSFLMERI